MKKSLRIFAAAWWGLSLGVVGAAQPPSPNAAPPAQSPDAAAASATPHQGDDLIGRALTSISQHRSLEARVRVKTDLFGQQGLGTGRYLQGPADSHRVRFELKLQVGNLVSILQHVCDGQTLWMHREINGVATLGRVDVARVLATRAERPLHVATGAIPELGVGGLPQLLLGLERSFRFTAVVPARLGQVDVHALRGEWEPAAVLAELAPDQQAALAEGRPLDLKKLPEHLPDQVVVYLGRDDAFPYRVEYRRTISGSETRTLVDLVIYEVQFNPSLDQQLFTFEPGKATVTDETARYLPP